MSESLTLLGHRVASELAEAVIDFYCRLGELTLQVRASEIIKLLAFLRDDQQCQFWCLVDITAVDWPGRAERIRCCLSLAVAEA